VLALFFRIALWGVSVSDLDPYRISATNNPLEAPPLDKTKQLKEVVVIVREDEEEENEADGDSIGDKLKPITAPITGGIKREASSLLNRTLILLFAGAAFLVILFALLLARGSGGESVVYCRDLPDWNQTANCL